MKRVFSIISLICLSFQLSFAQDQVRVREFDTDKIYSLSDLINRRDDNSKHTFFITWFDTCDDCKLMIDRFYNNGSEEFFDLITINIDNPQNLDAIVTKDEYRERWPNLKNLYWDGELEASFDALYTVHSGPLFIHFDEEGDLELLTNNDDLKPTNFEDYFGEGIIWNSSDETNTFAWNYYVENQENGVIYKSNPEMEKAISYVIRSIALEQNYNNTDTYAALLYLSGQYTAALKKAKEAIDIAKSQGEGYTTTSDLIQKIIEKM